MGAELVRQGYRVKGSTTRPEKLAGLAEDGIEPFLLTLDPWLRGERTRDFLDADVLFFNIPPGRKQPYAQKAFKERAHCLQKELHYTPVDLVIFASSTSVYPALNCTVVESDARQPESESGRVLLEVEALLLEDTHFDTTILRFAGLYGYERQPGRFLAGRKHLDNGEAPVNLIHRDDCVAIVSAILAQDVRGEVFNACSDLHPSRRSFYTQAALALGLEPPRFLEGGPIRFKRVSNQKLKKHLGYQFRYPDPLAPAP